MRLSELATAVFAVVILCVPAKVAAQADTVPRVNRRLRVELPTARYDGRIVAYTGDSIVLDTATASDTVVVRIPRTAVSRAYLHTGVSVRPTVVSGAIIGGLVALIVSQSTLESNEYGWGRSQAARFFTGAGVVMGGAVLGGLVGAWLAPDRWVPVDVRPYPTGR